MEVEGNVFQINDNNRKVLFNIPHVPNMIALCLTIKNRGDVNIFRSSVKGNVQGHVIKTYVTTRKVMM